tara:strand:+ start:11791 stop:12390 length:600 start_codon:yes stop_codon:yes gene_type:complete
MASAIDMAFAVLKAHDHMQMFRESDPDFAMDYRYLRDAPKYQRTRTVHPAIAAMLARLHTNKIPDNERDWGRGGNEQEKPEHRQTGVDWSNRMAGSGESIYEIPAERGDVGREGPPRSGGWPQFGGQSAVPLQVGSPHAVGPTIESVEDLPDDNVRATVQEGSAHEKINNILSEKQIHDLQNVGANPFAATNPDYTSLG